MKIADRVDGIVRETVTGLGYELDEVEFIRENGNWVLTLYIDGENGVSLDDCERVSRAVDPILDEADPIEQQYYLSVSSIGLDRPLKKERDYARNLGKAVSVKLYAPLEGRKEFTGTLTSLVETGFVVALGDGSTVAFARKQVALMKPFIEF